MIKRMGTGVAIAVLLVLAACGGGNNAGQNNAGQNAGETAPAQVSAEAVYKQNCISCHGDNLEGRMGARSNLTQVGGRLTTEQIAAKISNGGGGMPAFKGRLSDAEIGALSDWLAAKK